MQLDLNQRPLRDVVATYLRDAGWTPVGELWLSPRPLMSHASIYRGVRRDGPVPVVQAISVQLRYEASAA